MGTKALRERLKMLWMKQHCLLLPKNQISKERVPLLLMTIAQEKSPIMFMSLEYFRKEKSVLLPFWMVWCGFVILYMFSGLVISGVEAKYGHLVLFMMLLALFSYFQAVVYNYRSELIKKYDVKPVEMNRLDKRYGGLDLLNVSGE